MSPRSRRKARRSRANFNKRPRSLPQAIEARYACGDGRTLIARFSPPGVTNGRVTLTFATGAKLVLPQVMSADGGRYADNDVEFWIKGRNAALIAVGASKLARRNNSAALWRQKGARSHSRLSGLETERRRIGEKTHRMFGPLSSKFGLLEQAVDNRS